MKAVRYVLPAILSSAFVGHATVAAPPPAAPAPAAPADPKAALEAAKTKRVDDKAKAKAALVAAIDAQIKAAGAAGDLVALRALTSQKDAFTNTGVLPSLPALKDANEQYTLAVRKADGQLVGAYEVAIQAAADAKRADDAAALRKEQQAVLSGAADPPAAGSPEAILIGLDKAKADYQKQVADARALYVQAVQMRVDAATKAGDLKLVTSLQGAKAAAEADQALPPGLKEPTITAAQARYGVAVQTANTRLAEAYRDTVRAMTRAARIDKAQEVQAEMDALGLNPGAAAAGAGKPAAGPNVDASSRLAKTLPSFLTATGTYGTEKDGIRLAAGCLITTKAADFLSKDFVFDVTMNNPKPDADAEVGIGDGTHGGSLRLKIGRERDGSKEAIICVGDEWGKHYGDARGGNPYTLRIKRVGGPITVSIGQVVDGKFTPEASQTVEDPKAAIPGLSDKRAKLFFRGGMIFTHARLATGAAAAAEDGGGAGRAPNAPIVFPAGGGAPVAPAAANPAGGGADLATGVPLTSDRLPAGFTATGTYSVSPAGLVPADKCRIATRDKDFLTKDFVLDLHVDVPKGVEGLAVGIGDTTDDGSIRLFVRQDGGWGVRAFMAAGDRWGKNFGDVRVPEPHVFRIEGHGGVITVSVGVDDNGKFVPELSQTVADAKTAAPKLSERHAQLFFGGKGNWTKIRLVTGAAAAGAPVPAPAPVAPPKGKRK